jgi:hypothetical protein
MADVEDFHSSYLTFIVKKFANYGRFQIESICKIKSCKGEEQFFLLSPIMACNVYGSGQLIKAPAYMFQAIFSKSHYKIFRTYLPDMKSDNSSGVIESNFEGIELSLTKKEMVLLQGYGDVIRAARNNRTIQGRISLSEKIGNDSISITVDFPVKHINILPETNQFQVETGTIALPDPSLKTKYEVDRFFISYVAFSSLDKIDIVQIPTMKVLFKTCSINLYAYN